MSFQVGSVCYDTAAAATAAVAAGETGKVVPAGSVVYVVDAVASAAGSITYTFTDPAGIAASVVYTSTPTIPECGLLGTGDAVAMGWGVAGAWIAAYAILQMRKGV